jgi:hypothetical protein
MSTTTRAPAGTVPAGTSTLPLPFGGRTALLFDVLAQEGPQTAKALAARVGLPLANVRALLRGQPQRFHRAEYRGSGRGLETVWCAAYATPPARVRAAPKREPRPTGRARQPRALRLTRADLEARAGTAAYTRVALGQLAAVAQDVLALPTLPATLRNDLALTLAAARGVLLDTAPTSVAPPAPEGAAHVAA